MPRLARVHRIRALVVPKKAEETDNREKEFELARKQYEFNGEDSRAPAAIGTFRIVPETTSRPTATS